MVIATIVECMRKVPILKPLRLWLAAMEDHAISIGLATTRCKVKQAEI
jgi:hypothetical protein